MPQAGGAASQREAEHDHPAQDHPRWHRARADRPILVDVTASWCPTCRAQKPILARLLAEPRFAEIAAFEVDYDRQKDIVRRFEVRMQSTLIVFRGRDELGRSVGDTNPASIRSLLEMTL